MSFFTHVHVHSDCLETTLLTPSWQSFFQPVLRISLPPGIQLQTCKLQPSWLMRAEVLAPRQPSNRDPSQTC